jgi:subtilisin family serine protease
MKTKIIGICICMLLIAAVVLPATGTINKSKIFGEKQTMQFVPGEFIVKVKQDRAFSSPSLKALNEKHQVYSLEKVFPNAEGTILDNIYLLHVPIGSDILYIVQEYTSCPGVVYAEPNGIGFPDSIPNDANFSKQWGLHNTGQMILNNISGTPDADIDAPEAWDMQIGSPDVVIAIVDSGIAYPHPDLAANIWNNTDEIPGNGIDDDLNGYIDDIRGWDFYYNDSNVTDGHGHGTFCAGVAGAVTNNGIGIAGASWNCKIMPVRIANASWYSSLAYGVKGIRYAVDNGADVCSMSCHFSNSSTLKNVINYAYGKGVFLCAAAGNVNNSIKHFPAAYENVTAVAATNQDDKRCSPDDWGPGNGSNYGDWVDIAAPGNLIYSTEPSYHYLGEGYINPYTGKNWSQNYDIDWGTSYATPMVASAAALLLSKDSSLTPAQVKGLLCGNVDPYNSTEYIGTGRLNAQKALDALQSSLEIKIKGGLGVNAVITNNGTTDVTNIPWQIHVEGGILKMINKTVNGTIDIPAGKSVTVKTGMLLGFGAISIIAKVADEEQTATGTQIIIFSIVK